MSVIQHPRTFRWNRTWRNIDFSGLNEEGVRLRQLNYEIYVRGWLSKKNSENGTNNQIFRIDWDPENPREYSMKVYIDPGPTEDNGDANAGDEGGGNLSPTPPPQPPPPYM
jgi:hypothetical protein